MKYQPEKLPPMKAKAVLLTLVGLTFAAAGGWITFNARTDLFRLIGGTLAVVNIALALVNVATLWRLRRLTRHGDEVELP